MPIDPIGDDQTDSLEAEGAVPHLDDPELPNEYIERHDVMQVSIECWRCDQSYDETLPSCPLCAAENRHSGAVSHSRNRRNDEHKTSPAIVKVVWAFALLAGTSIAFALVNATSPPKFAEGTVEFAREVFIKIGVLEFVDTILVLAAFALIAVRPKWPELPTAKKTLTWLAAFPLLAVVLTINLGYHWWLRESLGLQDVLGNVTGFAQLWPWILITICIQPAIVEELFFRHVALGAALEVTPPTQAIFISSILFAMAHLGTPLSIPTLTLLGIVLGYLRLLSGGLLLPMLFHFLHNLIVVLLEQMS